MIDLEKQVFENVNYYRQNGKSVPANTQGTKKDWYEAVHSHFENELTPFIKGRNEFLIDYDPIWLSWDHREEYRSSGYSDDNRIYKYAYGYYGTGYVCISNRNVYLSVFNFLSKKYPARPEGAGGFLYDVVSGMAGERNRRERYENSETWDIPFTNLLGVQIKNTDSKTRIIALATHTMEWQIECNFKNTVDLTYAAIRMGMENKFAPYETITNQTTEQLLKELDSLKAASLLTKEEYEAKKSKLMKS